jgi:two-component system, OmpR family, sensor histidine kinase KdpD
MVTSVASMLCLNYFFLPPVLSLTIADPQNWMALFVFLVTAITASQLSSVARQRTQDAQTGRIEVERLERLSRSLMLVDANRDLGTQIARHVKEHFGFSAIAYCDGFTVEISVTSPDPRFEQQQLRDIAVVAATS